MTASGALDRTHVVTPRPVIDHEFERLQEWYKPSRVRKLLEEYRALLYPHVPEHPDERGMPHYRRHPSDVAVERRVNTKADIDRALTYLYHVARQVDEAEAIHLYYLTLDERGQLMTQERVARLMGCTERTVRNRIDRGITTMAWHLGFISRVERE